MATLPSSGPISFADIQSVMGGSGPVSLADYAQNASTYYARGVPGVTSTDVGVDQFLGKAKALKHGFMYRIFRQSYQFSTGVGGAAGSGQFAGGGGAGGVIINDLSTAITITSAATNGGGANGGYGGGGGTGFGAGGGGGGYWYAVGPLPGGNGANGCAYFKLGATEYFTQASGSYTFSSTGTVQITLIGGGGAGGNNAATGNRGGGGGGAGYIQRFCISVSNGTTATITIGQGGNGESSSNGGTTSVVVNGITYSAGGGINGAVNQYGGAGSSSGGSGGSNGGETAGYSGGAAGANTTSQGTSMVALLIKNEGGYYADDPYWFNSRTETYLPGLVTNMSTINTATGGIIPTDSSWSLYSVEWFGYFYAPTTGSYTFYLASDDASYLWIGNGALFQWTTDSALVSNGGLHPVTERSGTITLTANTYYPLRINMGENFSGDSLQASFSGPGISKTDNWAGYIFYGLGTASSFPGMSARLIKAANTNNVDRMYYINSGAVSTPTYCLMNDKWDGGGWMMMMKATRGNTFSYDSTYWTDIGTTLNTGSTDRTDADAKFAVMNSTPVKDVLALWPDVGSTGGSITTQSEVWSWLVRDYYYGTRIGLYYGFSTDNSRDATLLTLGSSDPSSFSGFSSSIWSSQTPSRRHVFGGGAHVTALGYGTPNAKVRWGFIFNENALHDYTSSDASGGIGMNHVWGTTTTTYSSGDFYGCCGTTGLNRSMRMELYAR